MIRWDWLDDLESAALASGDPLRARLTELHMEAYDLRESDPAGSVALYQEGVRLARGFGEPIWEQFYRRWVLHASMHFARDYRTAVEDAVRNTLETRKPLFDDLPHRLHSYEDLVGAYLGVDPVGHADVLEAALRHLEETVPDVLSRQLFLRGMRREFEWQRGRVEPALAVARDSLALAGSHFHERTAWHYATFVFTSLAAIHGSQGQWAEVAEASQAGAELARQVGHQQEEAECLLWHATALRHSGRTDPATRLQRRAAAQVARLAILPSDTWFEALTAWHEACGELPEVEAALRHELTTVCGRGRLAYECRTWIRLGRILVRQGRACETELAGAAALLPRLNAPDGYRAAVERLAAGDASADPAAPHI